MSSAANILIIEDNKDNRDLLDYLLRVHGYEPRLAEGGLQGIAMAQADPPDLILLDIHMPGFNGFEVFAALGELTHTRIVAVTASAMASDRKRIVAAGFHGYIQKPIDVELFIDEIENYLPDRVIGT